MAVVNVKVSAVSNADAVPRVPNSPWNQNGALKEDVGTVEVSNGDSVASTYRLGRLSSSARVSRILLSNDAIATSGAVDVGLYRTAADGGVVVDADLFASAVTLQAAAANVDVTHESGVFGIEDVELRLWQALGLTADPFIDYDLVATLTVAAGAGGTLSAKVQYVDGA